MIDHVRQVIARTLRIPVQQVGAWRLVAEQNTMSLIGGFVPANLKAELEVVLLMSSSLHQRLYEPTGSWAVGSVQVRGYGPDTVPNLEFKVRIALLYGKETQHIFKAAYQMFTVRGPQKKRRKK